MTPPLLSRVFLGCLVVASAINKEARALIEAFGGSANPNNVQAALLVHPNTDR